MSYKILDQIATFPLASSPDSGHPLRRRWSRGRVRYFGLPRMVVLTLAPIDKRGWNPMDASPRHLPLWLWGGLVVSQRLDDMQHFVVGDEAAPMANFVLVDCQRDLTSGR